MSDLLTRARQCRICTDLPCGPNPVFQISSTAKILIAAQAPGIRVHKSGRPFTDPSGDRLRDWMGIDEALFYNPEHIGIVPMGFCYPGTGKSGDLPPRKECASAWRKDILATMPDIALTLVIGQYAQDWHLGKARGRNVTETVRNWREYRSQNIIPLPHPSPRNNIWLKKNPWFEEELLQIVRQDIQRILVPLKL